MAELELSVETGLIRVEHYGVPTVTSENITSFFVINPRGVEKCFSGESHRDTNDCGIRYG